LGARGQRRLRDTGFGQLTTASKPCTALTHTLTHAPRRCPSKGPPRPAPSPGGGGGRQGGQAAHLPCAGRLRAVPSQLRLRRQLSCRLQEGAVGGQLALGRQRPQQLHCLHGEAGELGGGGVSRRAPWQAGALGQRAESWAWRRACPALCSAAAGPCRGSLLGCQRASPAVSAALGCSRHGPLGCRRPAAAPVRGHRRRGRRAQTRAAQPPPPGPHTQQQHLAAGSARAPTTAPTSAYEPDGAPAAQAKGRLPPPFSTHLRVRHAHAQQQLGPLLQRGAQLLSDHLAAEHVLRKHGHLEGGVRPSELLRAARGGQGRTGYSAAGAPGQPCEAAAMASTGESSSVHA
jgi:hypothetical protein